MPESSPPPPPPHLRLIENEAGAAEEKTTNECEPNQRGNPAAALPTAEKNREGERERTTAGARVLHGRIRRKRMLRETGPEGGKEINSEPE